MLIFSTNFRNRSSSFHGFDAHDVEQSEKRLASSKIELRDIPLPEIPEIDEMVHDPTTETLQCYVNESHGSDEPKLIVGKILEKVFDGCVQDEKVCIDSEHSGVAMKDVINQIGIETIPMPRDDPETNFFLSLS